MQDPQQTRAPRARLAANWRRYLGFWGGRASDDVDDELRFHRDMRIRDSVARGMSQEEARAEVARRMGNIRDVRAQCVDISHRRERSMTRTRIADAFVQDIRFAARGFVRQKGWTAVAILTLALGIGANTAVFSVLNRLVLNPLTYPEANRIALADLQPSESSTTGGALVRITPGPEVVTAWIEGSRTFQELEAYRRSDVTFTRNAELPVTLHAAYVRPTFPGFAGERVLLGRMFSQEEADATAPVALLGEASWRSRFGGDPGIIGQSVRVDEAMHTIIGVLPASLVLPRIGGTTTDLWLPLQISPNAHGTSVVGRLRPGVSFETARQELDTLAARAEATGGASAVGRFRARLTAPSELVSFRESLMLLMGVVTLVLLIACVNVAHLMLARSASRQREMAIRTALGAGRSRLFRQLITESLALSLAGCVGGLVVGQAGLRALVALRPDNLSALSAARLDGTVLLVAIALAVATGVGFGVFAAIQAARHATHESLKAGATNVSHSRGQQRLRSLLVITEMALSTTLLVGASLLVRSVMHLQTTDPGFDPSGLYAVQPSLPESRYRDSAAKNAFYAQLIERVRSLPGVAEVTVAGGAPPGFSFVVGALQLEGETAPPPGATNLIRHNAVSPSYFSVMKLPIVTGSGFADTTASSRELMVSEGFAKKNWPEASAVGRRVRLIGYDGKGEWSTVVGVVGDAAIAGLTHERSDPILYMPSTNYDGSTVILRVRPGMDALPALRSLVASLDDKLPPPTLMNIESAMAETTAQPRFTMMLLVSFTVLALILAAVGLYGVMSYAVAQRTREIGIRIALGATKGNVARDVVVRGVALAIAGATVGLAGAWWGTRVLESTLYGISRTDPTSFVMGAVILIGTAVVACIVPMSRAASVDPVIAMRAD